MATTLWPIIHRLAGALSLKSDLDSAVRSNAMPSKIAVLRTEFESTAEAIEAALSQWQPHLPPGFVPGERAVQDPDFIMRTFKEIQSLPTNSASSIIAPRRTSEEEGRIHSILHNALAYRHSAFVYLYRTVYTYPRRHEALQKHVHLSLVHCVATVNHAGPMGALLWPLFVAACEAIDIEDRKLAEKAFAAIKERQGMMNIERAWDIVGEVWRRADLAETSELFEFEESSTPKQSASNAAMGSDATIVDAGGNSSREACGDNDSKLTDLWRQVSRDMGVSIVFG